MQCQSKEDIFRPIIWNGSLYEINKDNGVRAVNFSTSEQSN